MLALLIAAQLSTRYIAQPFGQFITGSIVNLILLVSVFMIGLGGGLTVAVLSQIFAFFLGLTPGKLLLLVPFIIIANAIFVTVAWLLARKYIKISSLKSAVFSAVGLIIASVVKFLFLWVGFALITVQLFGYTAKKPIVTALSFPQLVTALIGSALALAIVPLLKRAIK